MLSVEKILQNKKQGLWSIGPKESAYKALEIMAEKDIGALLVMDKDVLVGIFTERDYSRKVILRGKYSKETSVDDLMTRKVLTVTPETSVDECMALMKAANCRHMPVFDKNQIVGMVTMRDVMNELISEKDILIQDLEHYIYESNYLDVSHNP